MWTIDHKTLDCPDRLVLLCCGLARAVPSGWDVIKMKMSAAEMADYYKQLHKRALVRGQRRPP
jgi:hypothetical protein